MNRLFLVSAVAPWSEWPRSGLGAERAPKGDTANGRKVYLADGCWQCHGRVGQGGLMTGAAPVLAQTRLPFAAFRNRSARL